MASPQPPESGASASSTPQMQMSQLMRRDSSSESPCTSDTESVEAATQIHMDALEASSFQQQQRIPRFRLIQPNTNLKTAPENWLRTPLPICGDGEHTQTWGPECKTSIGLAESVVDSWNHGDVDMISHAGTMKRLLKSPLRPQAASFAIHRVGNTMLVDDLDPGSAVAQDARLKALASDNPHSVPLPRKSKKTTAAQARETLESKFLYRSWAPGDRDDALLPAPPAHESGDEDEGGIGEGAAGPAVPSVRGPPTHGSAPPPAPAVPAVPAAVGSSSLLPGPETDLLLPVPRAASVALRPAEQQAPARTSPRPASTAVPMGDVGGARRHLWTFHDMRCLVASTMPIFGDRAHPAVSLRLCEDGEPINILTGLDYWLDNQMCNVPEVLMCYHLDGLVQRYELVRTDELPDAAGFEPEVVRDIAQNVLSFLRSNCTRQGHTYWLYKGDNEDTVRLYDLTVLCGDASTSTSRNPFAHPVAMLLFRIALRMMQDDDAPDAAAVRSLLLNVLELVDKQRHADLAIHAACLLTGLLHTAPRAVPPSPPRSGTSSGASSPGGRRALATPATLISPQTLSPPALPVPQAARDDAAALNTVLSHVTTAAAHITTPAVAATAMAQLACIGADIAVRARDRDDRGIALAHASLVARCAVLCAAASPSSTDAQRAEWAAVSAPARLDVWGAVARAVSCAGDVVCAAASMPAEEQTALHATIAAECALLAPQRAALGMLAAVCRPTSSSPKLPRAPESPTQLMPARGTRPQLDAHVEAWLLELGGASEVPRDRTGALALAVALYDAALQVCPETALLPARGGAASTALDGLAQRLVRVAITRQLGSALNASGMHHLAAATSIMDAGLAAPGRAAAMAEGVRLRETGRAALRRGVALFEQAGDIPNAALLLCNAAKADRVAYRAAASTGASVAELSKHHVAIISHYHEAQRLLGTRSAHAGVWDAVCMEEAGACLSHGAHLQDTARDYPAAAAVLDRAVELYARLARSDAPDAPAELAARDEEDGPRQRLAATHHRLARVHRAAYLAATAGEEGRRTHLREAERHFAAARDLYARAPQGRNCKRLQVCVECAELLAAQGHARGVAAALQMLAQAAPELAAIAAEARAAATSPDAAAAVASDSTTAAASGLDPTLVGLVAAVARHTIAYARELVRAASAPGAKEGLRQALPEFKRVYGDAISRLGLLREGDTATAAQSAGAVLAQLPPIAARTL